MIWRTVLGFAFCIGLTAGDRMDAAEKHPSPKPEAHSAAKAPETATSPVLDVAAAQSKTTPFQKALAPQPPFVVTGFTDVTAKFAGAPKLQSFAFARYTQNNTQYWIFIGGRLSGFHGFQPPDEDFPEPGANNRIWVISDVYGQPKTYSMAVSDLPASFNTIKPHWQATNTVFYQDFDTGVLWIGGGYGPDANNTYQTFPILSAVKLGDLVNAVVGGNPQSLAKSIAFTTTPLVQTTGAEMLKLPDNFFYVVMGHNFQGKYSTFLDNNQQNKPGPNGASQTYLQSINQFKAAPNFANNTIAVTPGRVLTLANATSTSRPDSTLDPLEFARRDLNVTYTAMQDGSAGLAAYGGVFTPNPVQLNYYFPIYLGSGSTAAKPVIVDTSYEQMMSAYSCAKIVFYSKALKSTYTTFFGGISRWRFDFTINQFVENARIFNLDRNGKQLPNFSDGVPWINTITTLVHNWNPTAPTQPTYEVAQPTTTLPSFIGSETLLIPNTSGTPSFGISVPGTDILDFDALPKDTPLNIGYLYGGILATPASYYEGMQTGAGAVPTQINDKIYQITIQVPSASN